MSAYTLKNIFLKQFLKSYASVKIDAKYLSISLKLFDKNQFKIKNKFAFQDHFKRRVIDENNSRIKIFSPDSISEQSEYEQQFDNSNFKAQGFVSGDLLQEKRRSKQPRITVPQTLKTKKPSLTYQGEILYGVHPVYLALLKKRRTFYHLYTREDVDSVTEDNISRKTEIIKLARSMNIPISFVDSRGLKILAPGAIHQGICLDAGYFQFSTLDDNECNLDTPKSRPLWLVLDELLDPMNVGAIIRSAYYFGVNKLFTVRGNSCKLSPTVSKASSGTLEVMDVYQIGNLEEFIKNRKDNGWCIVSTLAYSENKPAFSDPPVSADKFSTSKPTILILGNEGKGVSQNILPLCDSLISIEPGQMLPEGIDSLNVSVTAGVILYALNNSKNTER